ncbi:MAG: nucleotidyl transferase AbiEii/AbiGii toxin family protein [Parachlamydiaceae bacterium]
MAVDIGFGDIIEPIEHKIHLTSYSKGNIFENSIELTCYPKEFIFSEKLETIVHRGSFNSRMKDFHDLYFMISSTTLPSFNKLEEIIRLVFKHRKTGLILPIFYEKNEMPRMENFWREYLKSLRKENSDALPKLFSEVVLKINHWLAKNTQLIDSN